LNGKIEFLINIPTSEFQFQTILLAKLNQLFDLLEIKKKLPVDPEALISFDFAHYVGLSIHQELELIQIPVENERLKYLSKHLDVFIPHVLEVNNIKERAKLNGHIKYLKPPTF
jgi:hypothetical protein